MTGADWFGPFRTSPATSVICTDFDGTLSNIVADPAVAVPVAGCVPVLESLSARYADVVVVSGRPLAFLQALLPPSLNLVGLYGLEGASRGVRWEHPTAGAWREVMEDLVVQAQHEVPDGVLVEPKGLSLTMHYRTNPDAGEQVEKVASELAARSGVTLRPARMSVELHPPIDADKGSVVMRLAASASAVLFAGDDEGDLSAFDALDALAASGAHTVRVGVRSPEVPAALVARSDLVADGPVGVLGLLRQLVLD